MFAFSHDVLDGLPTKYHPYLKLVSLFFGRNHTHSILSHLGRGSLGHLYILEWHSLISSIDEMFLPSFGHSSFILEDFSASLPEHMEFVYHLTPFSGILAVHGILDGRGRLSEDRVRVRVPFHHLTLGLKPERCFL